MAVSFIDASMTSMDFTGWSFLERKESIGHSHASQIFLAGK